MKLKRHIPKRIRENFNLEDEDFEQMSRETEFDFYPEKDEQEYEEEEALRKLLRDEIFEIMNEEEGYDEEDVRNAEKIAKIELDTEKKKQSLKKSPR